MPSGKSKSQSHPNGFRRTTHTDEGKKALAPRSMRPKRRFMDDCTDKDLESAGISRRKRVTGLASWESSSQSDSGEWPSPN